MSTETPLVSVVLPVYNCEDYICESVKSILCQTFVDFELLIIDDGSIDSTYKKISHFKDPRVILIKQKNKGLPITLNQSFQIARGKYIARQDADDFSYPDRLEKQVKFLESNLDVGIVGTWAEIMVGRTKSERSLRHNPEKNKIRFDVLFDSPFVHSSIMLRKKVFDDIGGYKPAFMPVEDYEYWTRVLEKYNGANIPEILQLYRELPNSMIRTDPEKNLIRLIEISSQAILKLLGNRYSQLDIYNLSCLSHRAYKLLKGRPNLLRMRNIMLNISKTIDLPAQTFPRDLDKYANRKFRTIITSYYRYKISYQYKPIIKTIGLLQFLLRRISLIWKRIDIEKKE
jgi:glycosyltransferase involved in cell wall biosynthesis